MCHITHTSILIFQNRKTTKVMKCYIILKLSISSKSLFKILKLEYTLPCVCVWCYSGITESFKLLTSQDTHRYLSEGAGAWPALPSLCHVGWFKAETRPGKQSRSGAFLLEEFQLFQLVSDVDFRSREVYILWVVQSWHSTNDLMPKCDFRVMRHPETKDLCNLTHRIFIQFRNC